MDCDDIGKQVYHVEFTRQLNKRFPDEVMMTTSFTYTHKMAMFDILRRFKDDKPTVIGVKTEHEEIWRKPQDILGYD